MGKYLLMAALMTLQSLSAQTFDVYFGTYTHNNQSRGIYHAVFDTETGQLSGFQLAAETVNPSFLAIHPNKKFLYAVSEKNPGIVSAFIIDSKSKNLNLINFSESGGTGPCHVSVSFDGKTLLVSNYSSGSLASIPINTDGSLEKPVSIIQHEGKGYFEKRQQGPHVHSANLSPDNRFAFVADLGIDKVMIYQIDTASSKLTGNNPSCFQAKPGAGPRHFTFHPNDKTAYLINELDNTISVLSYNSATGRLTAIQTISTLPDDFREDSKTAEIKIHPNGQFLYGANRGHDSIAIYQVHPDNGILKLLGFQQKAIKNPRHFNIDPSGQYCLVANQDADSVVIFKINQNNGLLIPTDTVYKIGQPVCIQFLQP